MPRDVDVFERIVTALAADPASEFGAAAEVTALGLVEGPFSSVKRVQVRTPARLTNAYIKVFKSNGSEPAELARITRFLKREYDATRTLHEALGDHDSDIMTVRPIAMLPDLAALVTEEVPGRPLADVLADAGEPGADLATIGRRVGRWVRIYQTVREVSGVIDFAERRRYLDDRLQMLERRVLSSRERGAVLQRFDALVREIGAASVPAVAIHADLTPANIIVADSGRIAVLDFTMAKTGTSHHDLSHVYFHLALMGARARRRKAALGAVQCAMLEGYRDGLSAGDPLFRLMLLQHAVCHAAFLAERRLGILDAAYRWFVRRRWLTCDALVREAAAPRPCAGARSSSEVVPSKLL